MMIVSIACYDTSCTTLSTCSHRFEVSGQCAVCFRQKAKAETLKYLKCFTWQHQPIFLCDVKINL